MSEISIKVQRKMEYLNGEGFRKTVFIRVPDSFAFAL